MNFKAEALKSETLGLKLHPGAKKYWLSVTVRRKVCMAG